MGLGSVVSRDSVPVLRSTDEFVPEQVHERRTKRPLGNAAFYTAPSGQTALSYNLRADDGTGLGAGAGATKAGRKPDGRSRGA